MANQFVNFTPYDEQMAELQRRQRMADLLQQQAVTPLETPQSGGRMIAKVSPLAGLAKVLQGYMAGKESRDIEKRQAGLARQDIESATSLMDRLQAGRQPTVTPDQALGASLSQAPTATPQPVPFTGAERQQMLAIEGVMGGPRTRALAQILMSQKPETPEYYDAVPVTIDGVTKMVQYSKTGGAPRTLEGQKYEKPEKPLAANTVKIRKDGRDIVIDANTGKEIGAAVPEYHAPEQIVAIEGPDGKPMYVRQSAAVGKKPYETGGASRSFGNENTLRDEYNNLTSSFRQVQDAYSKIKKTSDTGAGDMSLLYSYVKMLDPGSAVKEGEFETAASSGSFGQRVQNAVRRIKTGGRLEPDLRQSFIDESNSIYQAQKAGKDRIKSQYSNMAKSYGLDPSRIIVDYEEQYPRKVVNGVTYENRGGGANDWHEVTR